MDVTVTKYLNVRIGQPSVNAPIHSYLQPGDKLEVDGKQYRGDVYDGNNYWYRDAAGNYYWSGAISAPDVALGEAFSTKTKFIDFHCHSILKPYSKSFKRKNKIGKNSLKRRRYSIWFKRELNILKKFANAVLFGVTKFTQADFTSALEGRAKVLMVSIDPMERELVLSKDKIGKTDGGKLLLDLVQGIGKKRMKYLENINDYFTDLKNSYDYLDELQNELKKLGNRMVTYKMVNSVEQINFSYTNILHVIPTIEGGHVFRSDLSHKLTDDQIETQIINNIKALKKWKVTPFFVALAHHFKNGLCGQADSLTGVFAKAGYNQETNANCGLQPLGKKVIDALISKTNGKRILIDVKHMNLKSRRDYYEYQPRIDEKIPIIVSHGATNYESWPVQDDNQINFYKEEIPIIAKSGGIFGVQLDARRLRKVDYGNKRREIKLTKLRRGLYKRAFFVWRQVEIMALLIYREIEIDDTIDEDDLDPWGFQVIGSDFDGVVDPLDGFWTHSEMPLLREYLIEHAETFLRTKKAKALPNYDQLNAIELVDKFMFYNAQEFLTEHFSEDKR